MTTLTHVPSHSSQENEILKAFYELKITLDKYYNKSYEIGEIQRKQLKKIWQSRFEKKNCPKCWELFNDLYKERPTPQKEVINEPFK